MEHTAPSSKPQLARSIKLEITIGNVTNTYYAKFPTNRQLIDIEALKDAQSNSRYISLIQSQSRLSNYAVDVVDMISYFTVLIPDILKDLPNRDLSQLDAFDSKNLVDAYKEQFMPWYRQWLHLMEIIRDPEKNETAKKAEEPNETSEQPD